MGMIKAKNRGISIGRYKTYGKIKAERTEIGFASQVSTLDSQVLGSYKDVRIEGHHCAYVQFYVGIIPEDNRRRNECVVYGDHPSASWIEITTSKFKGTGVSGSRADVDVDHWEPISRDTSAHNWSSDIVGT
jgi:hypothetical protein